MSQLFEQTGNDSQQKTPAAGRKNKVVTNPVKLDPKILSDMRRRYIAFDVETTGLDDKYDRIIEVGAVLFEDGKITADYGTLVQTKMLISASASAVNHITNDMLRKAPAEEAVYPKLMEFFGDVLKGQTLICAHNAKFDMGFLANTLERLGYSAQIQYVDTLAMAKKWIQGLNNYKQDTIAQHFGVVNEQAHRAVTDAEVCGKIAWEMLKLTNMDMNEMSLFG